MGPNGSITFNSYKDQYLSLGNGIKAGLSVCYNVTENIGVMANVGVTVLGGKTISSKITDISIVPNPVYTSTWKMNSYFSSANLGFRIKAGIGSIEPYLYLAPGFYMPFNAQGDIETKTENVGQDSSGGAGTSTAILKMFFAPGFGVAGAMGIRIKLSKVIGFNAEFAPEYAFARMTEYTQGPQTTFFKKNEAQLPTDGKTYAHGGPIISFSSLGTKAGLFFGF
jgi:hypothetical protein